MAEIPEFPNSESANNQTNSFDESKDEVEKAPVLPRQAWKSQLAYLKALLKAKQALDKSAEL